MAWLIVASEAYAAVIYRHKLHSLYREFPIRSFCPPEVQKGKHDAATLSLIRVLIPCGCILFTTEHISNNSGINTLSPLILGTNSELR